ncbi:hypothetical protein GS415_00730 [Rhodococcus hoagii]|nr:hypothetical protein [Prescottella equi]
MRSLLSDPRLEAIAGRPAAVATELGTWVTPEPDARLSGISLYVVYSSDGDTSRNYSGFVRYGAGGGSADGQLYVQTSSAGNDVIQVRADTNNGSANVGLASSGGRLAGIHTHSTVVEDGCTGVSASLDGGPPFAKPLTAGGGIPRERLIIDNGAGPQQIPLIAIAYNRAHSLPTRRRIEAYLKSIMRQQVTLGFHQAASAPQDKPIVESLPDGTTRITTTSTGTVIIYWQPIPCDLAIGSRVSLRANVTTPALLTASPSGTSSGLSDRDDDRNAHLYSAGREDGGGRWRRVSDPQDLR